MVNPLHQYTNWAFQTFVATLLLAVATSSIRACPQTSTVPKQPTESTTSDRLETFVTRRGAKLYDGDQEFRFLSFNIPELVMREEPYWGFNHPFEQADALQTIRAFGGRATRCYVMSISSPEHPGPRHIRAAQEYDEQVFRCMDRALVECHRAGVRLVVPFINNWKWWGGIAEFAALRGKSAEDFYTDAQLKEDYKHLVHYVLNRRNTISGIAYKDDPAILAWETGNELREAPLEWTLEMAQFIKSMDTNHLVIDGNDHITYPEVLESPDIDIVIKHYYRGTESANGIVDFEKRFRSDIAAIDGKKPFLVGEFGFASTDEITRLANAVVDSEGVGAMIWSLRQHEYQGGFRWHVEGTSGFAAYHWPGFPSGDKYDETGMLKNYHAAALRMPGSAIGPPEVPAAPTMLPIETVNDIRWRGSVGATGYDVQRSTHDEDWTTIATHVSDSVNSPETVISTHVVDAMDGIEREVRQHVFMQDLDAKVGQQYRYRVRAVNASGSSPWSEAVVVTVRRQSGFENLDLQDKPISSPLQIECAGDINSLLLVAAPKTDQNAIELQVSADGTQFSPVTTEFQHSKVESVFYAHPLPDGVKYLRIIRKQAAPLLRLQYGFGGYRVRDPRR